MITPTPRSSRIHLTLLVIGIVCLATTLVVTSGQSESPAEPAPADPSIKTKIGERFGKLPLSFEINKGQTDPRVKFLSRGPGYDLFLTASEAVLTLRKPHAQSTDRFKRPGTPKAETTEREGSVLRLKLIGANAAPRVEGQDELPGKVNYFAGNDPDKWRRNIPTYRKVHYKDVYPGIDMVYYGNRGELEYDFIVAPKANPKVIKFTVEGADRIRMDKTGNLLLNLKHGEVRLNKPVVYQLTEGSDRREVKGAYAINGNEVRFKLRAFDSSKPLVIDPVLSYSTYLGGTNNEQAFGIAVDSQGSAYVTGSTIGGGFPITAGSFKTGDLGGAFVTKLDPTGSSLVYSTYIVSNGRGDIVGLSIAVDAAGNAHVTGTTSASDFPIVNGLKRNGNFFKTTDAAANWNNNNTGLTGDVNALAIAANAPNILYACLTDGPYRSTDAGLTWTKTSASGLPDFIFATVMAVDPTNSSVVYLAPANSGLFKTTDGGNNWTQVGTFQDIGGVFAIAFEPSTPSTIYVSGNRGVFKSTNSGSTWTPLNNFGIPSVPNVTAIAIDPTTPTTLYAGTFGNGLFKTTNGGNSWTAINNGISGGNLAHVSAIAIDPSNPATIYVGHGFSGPGDGIDKSTNGGALWTPINNGVPPHVPIRSLVMDHTTSSTLYAATSGGGVIKTTNGGTTWTNANAGLWNGNIRTLVIHPSNSTILYVAASEGINQDAFVSKLNSTGSGLLFSTYLGGFSHESGAGIAVDGSGNIHVVGQTNSPNFPAVNAIQSAPSAAEDCQNAFVTKINPAVPSFVFSTYLGGTGCEAASSVALDPSANVYITGTTGSTDFPLANAFQGTIGDQFNGDAFVTKLNSNGSLAYSTYLGGDNADEGFGIAVDPSGNAAVTGVTTSTNFPTANPIQATNGGSFGDVFVTKFNNQGSALIYSTYLGGGGVDVGRGIAVDSTGNAYITGFTSSHGFPVVAGALRTRSVLFKSVDGAANWTNDNYGLRASFITDLAVHPTTPSIVYAGTLDGVFKSTNAGKSWALMNNGLDHSVVGMVIDPLTPTTIYVAAVNSGSTTNGVYKSTDGGNTWHRRANGMTNTNLLSLAIDPVTPTTLYAGASGGPIYKTTDGADNWAPSGNVPPIFPVSLAVDPHTPTTIFAAESSSAGGIFRSLDGGVSWQSIGLSQTGAHGGFVGVSPLTPGLVYAMITGRGIFKSVDGGNNWSQVLPLLPSIGKLVFDPVSASTLYFLSNRQGVLKTTDGGQNWIPINQGLTVPIATALAINPLRPSTLYVSIGATGDEDAFVTKINPSGSVLLYSTLIGGIPAEGDSLNFNDEAFGIAIDSAGNAYITGMARSLVFPTTPNSFQPFNRGFSDAFISKLTMSHIISGHVLQTGGAPLSGVDVVLNDGTSLTQVVTETDGSYEFSHLREGGTFTVSAAKPHFTMAPPNQTFSNLSSSQILNFTATATNAPFFTISGQVTNNGTGLAGVTVTLGGSQLGVRTTDNNGNYSFEVAGGGNYTVTPSVLGFTFGPTSQTFNNLSVSQTANFTASRQSFVVTTANNHGTGSLREAIINANATLGTDTIVFNISGSGVKVINLVTPLPEITEAVVIDASTQPGYAGAPLIELNGTNVGHENGFVIKAAGTTVRGFAIYRFARFGIWIRDCDNNVIQGNYIGIDTAATEARPNNEGIVLSNSSNNLIGGTTAAARNVISGNTLHGVEVGGSGNVIQGNFIGTNPAGTAAIANENSGIKISGAPFTNNLIGGATAGAANVISGNQRGISIEAPGNSIQGNLIGTDVTGTKKVPNVFGIEADGPNTLIGGLTSAARNIISGNGADGVVFGRSGSKLQGNFIGTDITGAFALGNGGSGVVAGDGALIGGTVPEARNVISANGGFGNVSLKSNSTGVGVTVQGNYIGIDRGGFRPLSETSPAGIVVFSSNNLIGGLTFEARNVISGNRAGIQLGTFNSGPPQGNVIQGNFIGLDVPGTGSLPNTHAGIELFDTFNNTVGGTQSGAANKIAFNGGPGVAAVRGSRNAIRGNSIFSNGGLGIDLDAPGVTPNDATDSDDGANNLQNFPVITSVISTGNSTTIQGSLKSTPNTTFQIDFYSSAALDPTGNGEGALFFNSTSITTDGNGDATINATFPIALESGRVVTATATDPNGNTSEFSAADSNGASGNVQFSVSSIEVIEDLPMLTLNVLRKGGSSGSLTVDFFTLDGTATGGQDYISQAGTLTFSSGQTSSFIQIPLVSDGTTEPDKTFEVVLARATTLENLGTPNRLIVTIKDAATIPTLSLTNASVVEGGAGSTAEALFTLSLSVATGKLVTVNFATSTLSATGGVACGNQGVDYENTSGLLTFQPGTTSLPIPVKICGDRGAESNETFLVALSNASNATIGNQALGTIFDDDVLELLLEDSGPTATQAAALDALLALRDPFRLLSIPEWFESGLDRNTRLVLFVRNLELNPGQSASAVTVRLVFDQIFNVTAEDVRPVPNVDFTQVVFRLPDNLAAGTYTVTVRAHGRISNAGTIRIVQ